jgi:hypothetical protein
LPKALHCAIEDVTQVEQNAGKAKVFDKVHRCVHFIH